MDLSAFFADPDLVRADLEKTLDVGSHLHSAAFATDRDAGMHLAALIEPPDPGSAGPDQPILASLLEHIDTRLLDRLHDAGTKKRRELLEEERVKLFSIVFALYRPAAPFRNQHVLDDTSLLARIWPGGETWADALAKFLPGTPAKARRTVRLDQPGGEVVGSGFLLSGGHILTAGHVASRFRRDADQTGARSRYNRVEGAPPEAEADITVAPWDKREFGAWDAAVLSLPADWRETFAASPLAGEFGVPTGLELQRTALDEEKLIGRRVAVIAHPVGGNAGGLDADVLAVFGNAALGVKRLMPGRLHQKYPLGRENGDGLLDHDCSTLGGASGGCLLDLETGKVLGIHIGGSADTRNRAVPAWLIAGRLVSLGLLPPE